MIIDPIARQEVAYRARRDIYQTLLLRADELEANEDFAVAAYIRNRAQIDLQANRRADRDRRLTHTGGTQ